MTLAMKVVGEQGSNLSAPAGENDFHDDASAGRGSSP
jgi:hypothetical protein